MSKKVKTILIGAAVIVVLAAVTALLLLMPEKTEEEEPVSSESTLVTIANQTSDQLKSARIKNADDDFTIELVGESLWRIRALEDFPANESRYLSARSTLCTLSAMQVVEENSQKLTDYGLSSPLAEIYVEFQDGTSYAMGLGNLSPDNSRRYAVRLDEDTNTVYGLSTSSLSCAFLTRNDFVDPSLIPAWTAPEDGSRSTPEINCLEITGSYLEQPIVVELIGEDDPDVLSELDTMKMTSPVKSLINSNWLDTNINSSFGISAEKVVKTAPTETELARYGLAEPFMTLSLQYDKTSSFKLIVGNGIDSEGNVPENSKDITSYYVMKEGTDVVYQAQAGALPWLNVQPRNLISSIITLPNITTVDNVQLTLDGKAYTLQITQIPSEDDASNANPDLAFTLNGQTVDGDMSRKFYQVLLSTAIQDINTQEVSGTPVMSIVYNQLNGKSARVDFYVQEDLTTIVSYNGNASYVGRSGLIDKVRKELAHLQNGETVDTDW